jgi:hypothetical protein
MKLQISNLLNLFLLGQIGESNDLDDERIVDHGTLVSFSVGILNSVFLLSEHQCSEPWHFFTCSAYLSCK